MPKKNKNPLKDKKWLKEFSKGLKKDIKQSQSSQKKISSHKQISEIICTQKDIGKPIFSKSQKKRK